MQERATGNFREENQKMQCEAQPALEAGRCPVYLEYKKWVDGCLLPSTSLIIFKSPVLLSTPSDCKFPRSVLPIFIFSVPCIH